MPQAPDNAERLRRIEALWRQLAYTKDGTREHEELIERIRAESDAFMKAAAEAEPES